MQTSWSVLVGVGLGFVASGLVCGPGAWAEEPLAPSSSSAFPEGSSSIIETRAWRVAGSDPAALRERTKTVVGQMSGAVLVKEEAGLLVVSLPTQKLSALRQELSSLGSVGAAEAETDPSAPTTLLRLTFEPAAGS